MSPLEQKQQRRRQLISLGLGVLTAPLFLPRKSNAAVVDERNAFGTAALDSSYRNDEPTTTTSSGAVSRQGSALPTDEIIIQVNLDDLGEKEGLGIELGQVEFRTNIRVFVKSVRPNSLADKLGIQPNWIVVSVNGQSAERTDAKGVSMLVAKAKKGKLELKFRDPSKFNKDLQNMTPDQTVTTQVAPAGDTTQRRTDGSVKLGYSETSQQDQELSVSQLVAPQMCNRGATTDDLLEISYIGILADTGQVFDGSAITIDGKAVPGRGNDVSLLFVLKKQPFGQFPPGWDVGLEGMCVGERRRVIIPPALAYGEKGVPRRGIPPNATLQYDITLISINGLAMPQ